MKSTIKALTLIFLLSTIWVPAAKADYHGKIDGKFFLQVEANGELWYILPDTGERYLINNPEAAYNLIKLTGIGISNTDLDKIPAIDGPTKGHYDQYLTKDMAGKFLLQVESKGEAWYVNPMDMKRYYLGRPNDAFKLFASIATGINNETALTIPGAKSIVDVAVETGSFNTLVAAVKAAGLADTLDQGGPFTVFAPTDEAFAKLPEGTVESLLNDIPALTNILLFHVASGKVTASEIVNLPAVTTLQGGNLTVGTSDGVTIGSAKVITPDVMAVNGVIHVIDTVLIPGKDMEKPAIEKNIIETAEADGSFSTLLAAVEAVGLTDTLSTGGPFTLFAPTDEAFAKLPEGTVESLLNDIPALTNILLYHVVKGKVMAADVVNLTSAETLEGSAFTIDTSNGVMVDNAKVTATDIIVSNGIIHVIDTVLIPG